MAIPLPRPGSVFGLTRSAVNQAAGLAAVPARAFGVLDSVERLVHRIDTVVDRVETLLDRVEVAVDRMETAVDRAETTLASTGRLVNDARRAVDRVGEVITTVEAPVAEAARVAAAADAVVAEARTVAGQAAATMSRAEVTAATADELLAGYADTLRRAAPMAYRFVEQLSPEEVDAAIALVDELPKLTRHLTADILPILSTLDRVGPDIHDLLEVTRDLKLAVAGIPGLQLLRRRGEDRLAADAEAPGGK